jgi:hypothetical protein
MLPINFALAFVEVLIASPQKFPTKFVHLLVEMLRWFDNSKKVGR